MQWLEQHQSEKQVAIEAAVKLAEDRVRQEAEEHWGQVIAEEQQLAQEKVRYFVLKHKHG